MYSCELSLLCIQCIVTDICTDHHMALRHTLKPIFHCDTKYLASGVGVGQCTRRQNFALPNAKYTNMLVYFALDDAHFSRFTQRET